MHNLFLTGREVEPESDVLLDSALALARLLIQVSDLDKLLQSAEALLEALKLLLEKSAPPALSPTVTLRSRSLSSSQQSFEDEDAIPPPPDADRSKSAPPVSPPASTPVAVPVARGYPEPGYSRKTSPRQGNGSARSASGPNSTSLGASRRYSVQRPTAFARASTARSRSCTRRARGITPALRTCSSGSFCRVSRMQ